MTAPIRDVRLRCYRDIKGAPSTCGLLGGHTGRCMWGAAARAVTNGAMHYSPHGENLCGAKADPWRTHRGDAHAFALAATAQNTPDGGHACPRCPACVAAVAAGKTGDVPPHGRGCDCVGCLAWEVGRKR